MLGSPMFLERPEPLPSLGVPSTLPGAPLWVCLIPGGGGGNSPAHLAMLSSLTWLAPVCPATHRSPLKAE